VHEQTIIVGGGIIGGSIAFELARRGRRVLLLDRQQPGLEASWAAAGMLAPTPDPHDAPQLIPLARASFERYPGFIQAVEESSGRRVCFEQVPAFHVVFGENAARMRAGIERMLGQMGIPGEFLEVAEALRLEPQLNPAATAVLRLPGEARVDNRLLTEAVLLAAERNGAESRSGVPVSTVEVEGGRCTGVRANGERIPAQTVVIAAGCYSNQIGGVECYAPTQPIRGQMLALRPPAEPGQKEGTFVRHVLRSEKGYVVPREDGRIVVGSTLENVGYEKRVTPEGIQQLLNAALELVPALSHAPVAETWSGLRPDTPDHLPSLGPTDVPGLMMATGHFRNGILLAPITAHLLRAWILCEKLPVPAEAFNPLRFTK